MALSRCFPVTIDLRICKCCVNLIKEIEGYVWDEKSIRSGVDKPMKQRDHAIDALRYVLFTHFGGKSTLKDYNKQEAHLQSEQKKWQQNPMAYPGFVNSPGWQSY